MSIYTVNGTTSYIRFPTRNRHLNHRDSFKMVLPDPILKESGSPQNSSHQFLVTVESHHLFSVEETKTQIGCWGTWQHTRKQENKKQKCGVSTTSVPSDLHFGDCEFSYGFQKGARTTYFHFSFNTSYITCMVCYRRNRRDTWGHFYKLLKISSS